MNNRRTRSAFLASGYVGRGRRDSCVWAVDLGRRLAGIRGEAFRQARRGRETATRGLLPVRDRARRREPQVFRQMAFCWWTGNGDMHLKNFSLVTGLDGTVRLSPAYDLRCTRLVSPDDQFALPVGGKRDGLTRQHWEEYGACCGLPPRAVRRELDRIATSLDRAVDLVSRSPLGEPSRARYIELLRARTALFSGSSTPSRTKAEGAHHARKYHCCRSSTRPTRPGVRSIPGSTRQARPVNGLGRATC